MCVCVCVHTYLQVERLREGQVETYGKLTSTYFHSINQKDTGKSCGGETLEQACVGSREEVTLLELDVNLQLVTDELIMQKREL